MPFDLRRLFSSQSLVIWVRLLWIQALGIMTCTFAASEFFRKLLMYLAVLLLPWMYGRAP